MDYIVEIIALGIDSIIVITCVKEYFQKKKSASMIGSAPTLPLDKKLKDTLKAHSGAKAAYVAIRGTVKPLGNPIISNNNPQVSGVIQALKIKEHVVQRSSAGYWSDSERTIQEIHNVVPFGLESKGIVVEVLDPLVAEYLDMEVISDTFHPTVPSMMDHIWGFFSGLRQRGIQSTEKMLRQGTIITGIGELITEQDGTIRLQPPTNGGSYYLTPLPVTSLLKKIEASKKKYGILALVFSAVGAVLLGLVIRKYLEHRKKLKEDEEKKLIIEERRKNRRRMNRDTDELSDTQICVVCRSNPREVILLPCGHVCLCEDCAADITSQCPICRGFIEMKAPAYVI